MSSYTGYGNQHQPYSGDNQYASYGSGTQNQEGYDAQQYTSVYSTPTTSASYQTQDNQQQLWPQQQQQQTNGYSEYPQQSYGHSSQQQYSGYSENSYPPQQHDQQNYQQSYSGGDYHQGNNGASAYGASQQNPYGTYAQPDCQMQYQQKKKRGGQKKRPFVANEPERPAKRVRDRSLSRSPRRDRLDRKEETHEESMDIHAELLGLSNAKMSAKRKKEQEERSKIEAERNKSQEREVARSKRDLERKKNVNFDQYNKMEVDIKPAPGKRLPDFVESYKELNLYADLQATLDKLGFVQPTPIQKYAIPVILDGQDVMATAQTGSGKTLAFLCPIIHGILNAGEVARPFLAGKMAFASPLALIVAPTRELAIQIDEETWKLTEGMDLSSFAVFGGENFNDQAEQIQKGQIDILTATPGRLLDMLSANKISLAYVRYLALDEADNILDLGLEKQIRQIVQERDMPRKEDRVTVLFSATFPSKIRELAKTFLRPHVFISVGKVGSTTESIQQEMKWVEDGSKKSVLLSDMKEYQSKPGKIIVFVSRRVVADHVAKFLQNNNFQAGSLHGKLAQWQREDTIHKFKDDQFRILVATSVAARGLDFPDINLVVNYDFPGQMADYTHRIGRTGRIGSIGKAISYFNRSNMGVSHKLKEYLKKHKQTIPHWLMFSGRRRY